VFDWPFVGMNQMIAFEFCFWVRVTCSCIVVHLYVSFCVYKCIWFTSFEGF
jgi:hypothetical protein